MCNQTYRLEAPDVPQALAGPPDTADDVDNSCECVLVKGLDSCDEAGVCPVVDDGEGWGDGSPDAEGCVHGEGEEEPGICQRTVIPGRIVDALVPAELSKDWFGCLDL